MVRRDLRAPFASSLLAVLVLACEPTRPPSGGRIDEETTHPAAAPIAPFTECSVYTAREPAISAFHEPSCSALAYAYHPPASGDHYSQWTAWGTFEDPIPWGFLVHSMEHGAVVLAYRPDTVTPEIQTAFRTMIDERGVDPLCRGLDAPSRFIVVPDPELEWPIAAVAWEHVYLATCVDLPSLRAFVDAHYGQAPEDFCAPGIDESATGWCP
jgi:hypothetical protein